MSLPNSIDHTQPSETRQMAERDRAPTANVEGLSNRAFGIALVVIVVSLVAMLLLSRL